MPAFATDPWFQELIDQINASTVYAEVSRDWEGDIAFEVQAEPDRGLAATVWGYLDLWHGSCRGGGVVTPDEGAAARYIIRAPYSRWREVVTGRSDPIRAMLQGKLRLEGDLPSIVRHAAAAAELVRCCEQVETTFPGEA